MQFFRDILYIIQAYFQFFRMSLIASNVALSHVPTWYWWFYTILSNSIWPEYQISSVQMLSHVQLFATPWTAALQASPSIINFQSLLKLMSVELVMPSNHIILCHSLFLSPLIFPSIRIFSNESVLHIRWPKYWGFSFSISPSNEYSGLISFRMG